MSEAAHVTGERNPAEVLPPARSSQERRVVFRDLVVLQLKLFISGWLHFFLSPATLTAAILDFIWKSDQQGPRFYRVLNWGHRAENALGIFAALDAEAIPSEAAGSTAGK